MRDVTLICAVIVFTISPMYQGTFGMIDDHTQVRMIGHRSRLPLSGIWPAARPLVFSSDGRWRPLQYMIVAVESATLGGHPLLWYLANTVSALVVAGAVYVVARRWLSSLESVLLGCLLVVAGNIATPWTRLGTSEVYAAPLAFAGGAYLIRASRSRSMRQRWPGFLALILAALCKESFIPLLPTAAALTWLTRRSERLVPAALCMVSAALVVPVLVVRERYGDVYGQQRSAGSALRGGRELLADLNHLTLWLFVLLIAIGVMLVEPDRGLTRKLALTLSAVTATGALILIPQVIVYSGGHIEGRYLTPSTAAIGAIIGTSFLIVASSATALARIARIAVVGLVLSAVSVGALQARSTASASAAFTRHFEARMAALARRASSEPVVYAIGAEIDYEPVMSVSTQLHARDGRAVQEYLWIAASTARHPLLEALERTPPWPIGRPATPCIQVVFTATRNRICDAQLSVYGGKDFPVDAVTA